MQVHMQNRASRDRASRFTGMHHIYCVHIAHNSSCAPSCSFTMNVMYAFFLPRLALLATLSYNTSAAACHMWQCNMTLTVNCLEQVVSWTRSTMPIALASRGGPCLLIAPAATMTTLPLVTMLAASTGVSAEEAYHHVRVPTCQGREVASKWWQEWPVAGK